MFRVLRKPVLGVFLVASALLTGCASRHVPPIGPVTSDGTGVMSEPPVDPNSWKALATPDDEDRLRRIDGAWTAALAEARPRNRAAITREGALLEPAGGLTRAAPSPGQYRCRVITLGRGTRHHTPVFQTFKPQTCFVQAEEKLLVLMKATGSSLPGGRLWDDGDKRLVFLGAMAPKPGAGAPAYGSDARGDRAGILERVGDFRWRLVTPWQADGPTIEVMELVPEALPPVPAP